MAELVHELIPDAAARNPAALGLERLDRVAVLLEKRDEAVAAMLGAAAAGCVFVPASRKAWCSRTATWSPGRRAWRATWARRRPTASPRCCRSVSTMALAS